MDEIVAQDRNDHLRRKSVLKKSYDRNMIQIKRKSVAFQQLAEQLGTSDSEAARARQLHALDSLQGLRDRVSEIRDEIRGMERRIAILNTRLAKTGNQEEADEKNLGGETGRRSEELSPQELEHIWEQAGRGIAPPASTPREQLLAVVERAELGKSVLENESEMAMEEFTERAKEAVKLGGVLG